MSRVSLFLGFSLLTVAVYVQAQPSITQQLHEINQQRILLEAQLKRAELQKRLLETQAEVSTLSGSRRAPARGVSSPRTADDLVAHAPPPVQPSSVAPVPPSLPIPSPAGFNSIRPVVQPEPTPSSGEAEQPTVSSVEGLKGALSATLVFKNQSQQRVRAGDMVPGGVIDSIELDRVILRDSKTGKLSPLRFAGPNGAQEGVTPGLSLGSASNRPMMR